MHGVLATTLANSNTNKSHVMINDKCNLPKPAPLAGLALDTSFLKLRKSTSINWEKIERKPSFVLQFLHNVFD